MMNIIKPGTKFDFIGRAPLFSKISIALVVAALVVIFTKGVNMGLDFAGGHQILLEFQSDPGAEATRRALNELFPNVDTAVQSYDNPDSDNAFYLVRIERSETLGAEQVAALKKAFEGKYGSEFRRLRYNPEAGDVVEIQLADTATVAGVETSTHAIAGVVGGSGFDVRVARRIGRDDQFYYSVVLKGVDVAVVKSMRALDPNARAAKVEFVGPTVGRQLRDDGLLAVLYALGCILIYIAFRFDFFYSPGAILCLFHDSLITVAILSLIGEEFSLATIAGLLTLVGYSINDTIVVFDRIRETALRAQGSSLKEILNRAINETLGRTVMTSLSTMLACVALMWFGRGTVLASFGLIMAVGIVIGTYSSVYVASPVFLHLRERFGPEATARQRQGRGSTAATRA